MVSTSTSKTRLHPATKLYRNHSKAQLLAMQAEICGDPANRRTGSVYLYTPEVHRKLDAIAMAITYHLQDAREAAGDKVLTCGYSGRQENR